MPLPRPASPRVLWNDLRAFWRDRPRHQYVAAFLAILVPIGIVTVFFLDSRTNLMPRQTLQFVNSWPASRSDAEIQAKQKADAALLEARRRERREQFQRIDNNLNRLGI